MRARNSFLLVFALVLGLPAVSLGATLTWPGGGPCGAGLQACINAASAGDVVLVATASMIQENLIIDKSLTLKGASGFTPWLAPFHFIFLSNPSPRSNVIVLEGFYLDRCRVQAVQASTASFDVAIRNLIVSNSHNDFAAITVRTGQTPPYGPVVFDVSNNTITIAPGSAFTGLDAISIQALYAPSMTGTVRGNTIHHFQGGQYAAINLYNESASPFDVDVIANHIDGNNFNAGVIFTQYGGTSQVRYLDNLVVGQINEAGVPGAYVASIQGGTAALEIVNNTAVDGDNGILISCANEVGATWAGKISNNIVFDMSHFGIQIEEPTLSRGTAINDHNLVYDTPVNFFTPGPGTLFENPLFVGGGSWRLSDESPARNSGNPDRVPADLTTDLDGLPRQVQVVDRGAYENQNLDTTDASAAVPHAYRLHSNVPNPFNPSTTIGYDVPATSNVQLDVLDVQGRVVRTLVQGRVDRGRQEAAWDGIDREGQRVASGVYFYRLQAGSYMETRRMVLLK